MSIMLDILVENNRYLSCLNLANLSHINITGVTSKSHEVGPGFLFVAKKGATPESRDGHDFIEDALERGAVALIIDNNYKLKKIHSIPVFRTSKSACALAELCEAFWGYPSKSLSIIGITGTNGKTSTSFMLHSIFKTAGFRPVILGTLGMGHPGELSRVSHTTPEPEFLSKSLAYFRDQNYTHVILEASSHGIILERLRGLSFSAVGLTTIGQDHLDFHGSMSEYIRAKQMLFDELAHEQTYKIIPCNHNFKFTYNLANLELYDPNIKPAGLELPGDFQINNAALAHAIAHKFAISAEHISLGLKRCLPVPGRLEQIKHTSLRAQIFIDFAHTPDALEALLRTARKLSAGRIILVFGCGGERDQNKRTRMAHIAQELADILIITDDNPRREDPDSIRQDIISGLCVTTNFYNIGQRREAIKTAVLISNKQDIIIIAGKGHENYQIYGNKYHDFCDRSVVEEILRDL
jgi:UDP-N-acetylmuramoyl-L-alanyl-D-glutamate--2,6-diaminopimelate ligase